MIHCGDGWFGSWLFIGELCGISKINQGKILPCEKCVDSSLFLCSPMMAAPWHAENYYKNIWPNLKCTNFFEQRPNTFTGTVSGNTELLNNCYVGNDGTCDHIWLTMLSGSAPLVSFMFSQSHLIRFIASGSTSVKVVR